MFLYFFGAKLVFIIRLILFFDLPKVIVWVILNTIYIISHFIFQSFDSKPIMFTATAYCHHSICKWQYAIIICVVCYITIVIWLRSYIVSINLFNMINRLLKHNIYRFFAIIEKKLGFFWFWSKTCSYDLNDLIFQST